MDVVIELFPHQRFDNALSGEWRPDSKTIPPAMTMEGIKYWFGFPQLAGNRDVLATDYNYIVAHIAGTEGLRKVVGLVELQLNPRDRTEVWLKYISVLPEYQHQGIGTRLCEATCRFLASQPWHLVRSRPSDEGELFIKKVMTASVLRHQVKYSPYQADWY